MFKKDIKVAQSQIKGHNFHGAIKIKGDTLTLDITQFKKGAFYTAIITDLSLEKEFRRFLIFKKVDDLFNELMENKNIQVSDQNTLVVPIEVQYKGKMFQLKVELPLEQRKFDNQEKTQYLFSKFQKLNQQKLKIQTKFLQFVPQLIIFKGDQTNQRYNTFELYDNNKKLKMLGTNQHTTFNHCQPLEKKGIFYFKIRIIKTGKAIFMGICGKEARSLIRQNGYYSLYFMGFYLGDGHLYGNGSHSAAASGFTIVDGQSIMKVEIDMNKQLISWFHNDSLLYVTGIATKLMNQDIYLMVNLYTNGDVVQFLSK